MAHLLSGWAESSNEGLDPVFLYLQGKDKGRASPHRLQPLQPMYAEARTWGTRPVTHSVRREPRGKTKAAIARGLCGLTDDGELLGCHFFGFAFLPHQLQFALGFLEGSRDFLLHAGSSFFEFLR